MDGLTLGMDDGFSVGITVAKIANLGRKASVNDSLLSIFSSLSLSIKNVISSSTLTNQLVTSKVSGTFVPVQSKSTVIVLTGLMLGITLL